MAKRTDPEVLTERMQAAMNLAEAATDERMEEIASNLEGWHGTKKHRYRWEIGDDKGYALRVEITEADSIEHARTLALSTNVVLSGSEATDDLKFRPLGVQERQWIKTTDPDVIVDTRAITMSYAEALATVSQLAAQGEAFRKTRVIFRDNGIDVFNPQAWVDAIRASAASEVAAAKDEFDHGRKRLAAVLRDLVKQIDTAAEATGMREKAAAPPPPPDYSDITVLLQEGVDPTTKIPELVKAGINVINRDPTEEFSPGTLAGLHMVLKPGGIIEDTLRSPMSMSESAALTEALHWIRAAAGPRYKGTGEW